MKVQLLQAYLEASCETEKAWEWNLQPEFVEKRIEIRNAPWEERAELMRKNEDEVKDLQSESHLGRTRGSDRREMEKEDNIHCRGKIAPSL